MEKQNWDIGVTLGYYGEEIETVVLEPLWDIREWDTKCTICWRLEEKNWIPLTLEYGSVLKKLENCNYEIIDVDRVKSYSK
jgi:hypothetical protein